MMTQQAPRPEVTSRPEGTSSRNPYGRLAVMGVLVLVVTYLLLYAGVDTLDEVVLNLNQFYLAGLIATVLGVLELVVMRDRYRDRRVNAALFAGLGVAAVVFFALIREQGGISDRQLVRSMIPHHATAIHMCEAASLQDPEITQMCSEMIASQQREVEQLKTWLRAANE